MTDAKVNKIFVEIRESFSPDEKWISSEKRKLNDIVHNQYDTNLIALFFSSFKMSRKFVMAAGASLIFLAGLVGIPVVAQAKEVGPGDLLYPVDLALENIELAMSSKKGDVVLLREQLDERVEESEEDNEGVSVAVELYDQKVEELEALLASICEEGSEDCNEDMVDKIEHVGFATLKHVEVLAGVYDKQIEKGNENAADAILGAMEKSLNGHDQAVESLQKSKENSEDEDGEESTVTDEELRAGKDKAKQKIEAARARGRGRNK